MAGSYRLLWTLMSTTHDGVQMPGLCLQNCQQVSIFPRHFSILMSSCAVQLHRNHGGLVVLGLTQHRVLLQLFCLHTSNITG